MGTRCPGDRLNILVENMGRINYGHAMTDPKVWPPVPVRLVASRCA
jgi:hypothetical protein